MASRATTTTANVRGRKEGFYLLCNEISLPKKFVTYELESILKT
jgi:hypothetical protein